MSERDKNMREKIETVVLRFIENFEVNFDRGSFAILSHTVKITGERPGRRGLGRWWDN